MQATLVDSPLPLSLVGLWLSDVQLIAVCQLDPVSKEGRRRAAELFFSAGTRAEPFGLSQVNVAVIIASSRAVIAVTAVGQ